MNTMTQAAQDVLAERERQKTVEGWTEAHDDAHGPHILAAAAAAYAQAASNPLLFERDGVSAFTVPRMWPWDKLWWKPTGTRRDLVKSAALAIAALEAYDRATPPVTNKTPNKKENQA